MPSLPLHNRPPVGQRRVAGVTIVRVSDWVGRNVSFGWKAGISLARVMVMDRLSKIQIIVGAIAALLVLAIRSGTIPASNPALSDALEGLGFILCAVAVLASGRRLRQRYQDLGSEKRVARGSADFMEARQSVRWWSYIAALVIASLASVRFDLPATVVVGALAVVMPIAMIIADQASGWGSAEA